jgi:orotate phosphoribosyltransferase
VSVSGPTGAAGDLGARIVEAALLRGHFVLRSGQTSSVYLDKYRFETRPDLLGPIGRAMADAAVAGTPPDRLAAPALGGVALAAAAALACGLSFVIVREAAKGYGTANRLEGTYAAGERVVVLEDVVTTGGAALEAVEALREAGLTVDRCVCVLDREQGGSDRFAAAGVDLVPLFTASGLGIDTASRPG